MEYFGRPPDYNVRQDSVVRNEAGKLRARLAEYYVAEGAADRLIIELPKGGYKPAFRQIEKATAPGPAVSRHRVWIWPAFALAGSAIVLTVARDPPPCHRRLNIPQFAPVENSPPSPVEKSPGAV